MKPRLALVLAAAVFFAGLGYVTVKRSVVKRSDFPILQDVGRSVLNGGADLYTLTEPGGIYYIYPPPFAVLSVPLAFLSPAAAATLWYILNLLCLAVGCRAALVLATPPGKPLRPSLLAIPLLLLADPLLTTISRGQVSILMFTVAAVGLKWHLEGAEFKSGFLTTCAALVKVYPALLVFYLVFRSARRRDWRALWGILTAMLTFGAALPLAAFGPTLAASHWIFWLTRIAFPFLRPADAGDPLFPGLMNPDLSNNASIGASLTHVAALIPGLESPAARAWIRPVAIGLCALLILALPLIWRGANNGLKHYGPIFEWSAAALIGIVSMPMAHIHYFSMLLLPLTAIVSYLHYEQPGRIAHFLRNGLVAVAVLIGIFTVTSLVRTPLEHAPQWHHWVMTVRGLGAYCWSAVLLAGVFSYLLTRPAEV